MVDNPIQELSTDEAWELLGKGAVGRLAVTVGGHPDIFPVNYYAGEGRILFRTAEGTKLSELVVNENVAFEVDSYDGDAGWSVVVKGTARILSRNDEIAAADETPLSPWIPTIKYNYVEIAAGNITGRRFQFGPEPERYPV
ncbi:pyridoxamine 5'-phosphate oxidase family protein [Gordonia sp. NB41Y]|uniref:pyridoxamine 5'-phosphate oxidase family protein n=1 Tax=Gordonia sp. NB41Y TaxID=875808 RepID=UPI0002BDF395|nr:pyridoxamine 5'-phosphate oxidase family protein [Gordonia sp. NB41Y]EMP10096.1 pyridoxamine 5'-phosphate oxidase [Gordonia sp. NB41Y]WLP91528.1 pyridoxamine 5'-phosphate oxidase family protein [Gordonia sp. NB41Y]